jgi:hypothetical protein
MEPKAPHQEIGLKPMKIKTLSHPRFESRGNMNVRVLNVRRVKTLLNVRSG